VAAQVVAVYEAVIAGSPPGKVAAGTDAEAKFAARLVKAAADARAGDLRTVKGLGRRGRGKQEAATPP
jgi:hypothetical protein